MIFRHGVNGCAPAIGLFGSGATGQTCCTWPHQKHREYSPLSNEHRLAAVCVRLLWSLLLCWLPPSHAQLPLTANVAQVSTGGLQNCIVTTNGGAKCWGNNNFGGLGTGACFSCTNSLAAVDVQGLASGVRAIAAARWHVCALTIAGGVKCWGTNGVGELGTGGTEQHVPTDVFGLTSGISDIAVGVSHTCALTNVGGVKCWGANGGLIGNNNTANAFIPQDVAGLSSGIKAVAAGGGNTCALTTAGGVKCWGALTGDGTQTVRLAPVDVTGLTTGVIAIVSGSAHNCALTAVGGVKCWGADAGTGSANASRFSPQLTPLDVPGLTSGVAAIAAGSAQTCVLTNAGGVKCFGLNTGGQLGDGTTTDSLAPVNVVSLGAGVRAIAVGSASGSACALTNSNGLKCWGANSGDGTAIARFTPVDTLRLSAKVVALAGGGQHHCALTLAGAMKCWGNNNNFQLGDWQTTSAFWPTAVPVSGDSAFAFSGATSISAGEFHSCGVDVAGGMRCWGRNVEGQIGNGAFSSVGGIITTFPYLKAATLANVRNVAAGYRHSCAVTISGGAMCWGDNSAGQLGDSTKISRATPQFVPGLATLVSAIKPGQFHTCAITTGGAAKCWGNNSHGQVGDGTLNEHLTLTDVFGLSTGVKTISLGIDFSCALTTAGGVKCWGKNGDGQLGDGTLVDKLTPVDVIGLASGVSNISSGTAQTCALMNSGGVKCWGFNIDGRLGDGTVVSRTVPVDVVGMTSGVSAISTGFYQSCAALIGGGVKCWGNNSFGQLGDNTTTARLTAVNTDFTYDIVLSAGSRGSISPTGTLTVAIGEPAVVGVTPNTGYAPVAAGSCEGALVRAGQTYSYISQFVYGGCNVALTFKPAVALQALLYFLFD